MYAEFFYYIDRTFETLETLETLETTLLLP